MHAIMCVIYHIYYPPELMEKSHVCLAKRISPMNAMQVQAAVQFSKKHSVNILETYVIKSS